jgi:hypothetical protein
VYLCWTGRVKVQEERRAGGAGCTDCIVGIEFLPSAYIETFFVFDFVYLCVKCYLFCIYF